jgi:hypothetical protein
MKIATLAAVVALACGTAFAAGNNSYGDQKAAPSHESAAAANDNTHSGDGLLNKTKRALHRMGEKMRGATHRVANSDKKSEADRQAQASGSDTRSMGAAGSNAQDSARQRRMDDAYSNWQSRQKK